MKQLLVFGFLAIVNSFVYAGDEGSGTSGGGDGISRQFVEIGKTIVSELEKRNPYYPFVEAENLKKKVETAIVQSTQQSVVDSTGAERDAINDPAFKNEAKTVVGLIKFNIPRWKVMDMKTKRITVFHEYLSLMGIEKTENYYISETLPEKIKPWVWVEKAGVEKKPKYHKDIQAKVDECVEKVKKNFLDQAMLYITSVKKLNIVTKPDSSGNEVVGEVVMSGYTAESSYSRYPMSEGALNGDVYRDFQASFQVEKKGRTAPVNLIFRIGSEVKNDFNYITVGREVDDLGYVIQKGRRLERNTPTLERTSVGLFSELRNSITNEPLFSIDLLAKLPGEDSSQEYLRNVTARCTYSFSPIDRDLGEAE